MKFCEVLGVKEIPTNITNTRYRTAIRAIIYKNDKLLLVNNNKGDYKFPGGGVKSNETPEQTLIREVQEETGYIVSKVIGEIGEIIERNFELNANNSLFEMTSCYYLCEILDEIGNQNLDDYEAFQEFTPKWISIEEAICENEQVLICRNESKNPWVYRETTALKFLRNLIQ